MTMIRPALPAFSLRARVVELVDAPDSKSGTARCVGSIPTSGTSLREAERGLPGVARRAKPGLLSASLRLAGQSLPKISIHIPPDAVAEIEVFGIAAHHLFDASEVSRDPASAPIVDRFAFRGIG